MRLPSYMTGPAGRKDVFLADGAVVGFSGASSGCRPVTMSPGLEMHFEIVRAWSNVPTGLTTQNRVTVSAGFPVRASPSGEKVGTVDPTRRGWHWRYVELRACTIDPLNMSFDPSLG